MIREKWFYVAAGVLLTFLACALLSIRITQLTERVRRLENAQPVLPVELLPIK